MRALKYLSAIPLSGLLILGACGDDDGPSPSNPDAAQPMVDAAPMVDAPDNTPDAMLTPAQQLYAEIKDYDQGGDWAALPGFPGIVAFEDHGATHRQVYSNSVYNDDLATITDGAILVKENRTGTDGADLAALTVMKRVDGAWIYANYMPDGTSGGIYGDNTETAVMGGCASSACHGKVDADDDGPGTEGDELFLNNQAVAAKATFDAIYNPADAADKYDASSDYFGFDDKNPQDYLDGAAGHGVAWQRIFINSTANDDETGLPNGSILIKEERSGDADGDGSASTLDALTIMERTDATNNVWLWSKIIVADGKVKFAGEDSSAACSNDACHGKADSGADKVFENGMDN